MALNRLPTKEVPLTQDNLAARMARFVEGQLTWPAPGELRKCAACVSFLETRGGQGRCSLVKTHTRKAGKLFSGSEAFACAQFRGPE